MIRSIAAPSVVPGTAFASASAISNKCRDRGRRDTVGGEPLDGLHRGVVDGDARELEQPRLVGRFFEEVAASPDKAVERHDLALAQ